MSAKELHFTFDGRPYSAIQGETIAEALYRNDVLVLTRSMKFHRPRGLYCGTGDCPNCMVNVNGIPNVRSCRMEAAEGMVVKSQNAVLSRTADPFSLIDYIFPKGLNYHHRFIRPSFARGMYQGTIRRLTGSGKLPTRDVSVRPTRAIAVDALVVGEDVSSFELAKITAASGLNTLLVGHPDIREDEVPPNSKLEVMRDSRIVGGFDDRLICAATEHQLSIIEPRAVALAETSRENPFIFVNWDLPGILQERAATMLVKRRILPGKRILIAGDGERSRKIAIELHDIGAGEIRLIRSNDRVLSEEPDWLREACIQNGTIVSASGSKSVSSVLIARGKETERIKCDCVITCGKLSPKTELARQLGCEIVHEGKSSPRIRIDEKFRTSVRNVFALGESAGIFSEDEATRAVRTVADDISSVLKEAR